MDDFDQIDRFLKSRNEALISGDIEMLRKHLAKYWRADVKTADKKVLEIILHKIRVHWRDCPPVLLKESVWWLLDHGYSLMV